ncbi:MaoC family dehydratase [soil metagenome]
MSGLYLEDLSVGGVFRSEALTITEAEIIAYAQTYDPQPFHTDPEAAKSTFFGGLAASGWQTAGLTMRLLVTSGIPLAEGIIGAGGEISWPRATRPGDVLHVESTLTKIVPSWSKPDQAMVTAENLTVNQEGDVVQRFVSKLVVKRRATT